MGHWETEHGEIVLPSAEFAAVRQTVQKAVHDHKTTVFEETQAFWKGLTRKEQTDWAAYVAAMDRHLQGRRREIEDARRGWGRSSVQPGTEEVVENLCDRLTPRYGTAPARVLKSDMDFPTNRTTEFRAGEGSIVFNNDTNMVTFETGEYRNVIEKARNSPAGSAFFARLKTVKWTRRHGRRLPRRQRDQPRGNRPRRVLHPGLRSHRRRPGALALRGIHRLEGSPGHPGGTVEPSAGTMESRTEAP